MSYETENSELRKRLQYEEPEARPLPNPRPEMRVGETQRASNAFGLAMLKRLAKQDTNFLFAPISAYAVLAMTPVLFAGETRAEILSALQIDANASNEDLCEVLKSYISSETSSSVESYQQIWWNERVAVPPEASVLERVAGIGLERAAFPDPGLRLINQAVENGTHGHVTGAVDELSEGSSMILVNAAHFIEKWEQPFHRLGTLGWTKPDGSRVHVDYMTVEHQQGFYLETDKYKYASIPYKSYFDSECRDGYVMVICLPLDQQSSVLDIDAQQFMEDLENLSKSDTNCVDVTIPRFVFETGSMNLIPSLTDLGIRHVFDCRAESSNGDYFVDTFVQKTRIHVDEYMTGASGSSASGLVALCHVASISADRPFIYAIQHVSTGALVFIGYVSEPHYPAPHYFPIKAPVPEPTGTVPP